MFARILFPTGFDEFAFATLKSLACLKRGGLRDVVLLHVIDTEGLSAVRESGLPVDTDKLESAAKKELAVYEQYLQSEGIGVKSVIGTGPLVATILETAARESVSLIIAGRQKRDVLGEIFVGSTTDRIIRKSGLPVLVAKYHVLTESNGMVTEQFCSDLFRKILYPTDWSACADRAKQAIPLLRNAGASEVIVAHVIEELPPDAEIPSHFMEKRLRDKNLEDLDALRQEFERAGFTVSVRLVSGRPFREINRIATESEVSLIVMGSHGRGLVDGLFWGSVSQRVVEYSEKPVLVVK